jgi:tripartite-type tricarboxylate transporter receptor subunit TctC
MERFRHLTRALFCMLAIWCASPTWADAQIWPNKPVRIIVAFGPGGTADILGRLIAAELSTAFKQQFYVENKPGNSGTIGSAFVARSEPDGYTLLIGGAGPHLVAPAVNPNVGYDTMRDFNHIALIAGDSFMLAANPATGLKSFADLVRAGHDTAFTCASPGVGSQGHLVQELINQKVGIRLQPIPYRGAAEAMTDLIGNHVALALQPAVSVGEHVQAGRVVGLAVTSTERISAYPEIPTLTELGYDVRGLSWFWLAGPRGISADIIDQLNMAVRRALKSPQVREQFARSALLTEDLAPAEVNKFIADEVALWGSVARQVGLKIQ